MLSSEGLRASPPGASIVSGETLNGNHHSLSAL